LLWASDEDVLTNIVKLNTSATMQVDNDEMTVLLAVEHQGANSVIVAHQVNQDMRWALEKVKHHQSIIHETYSTRPIYNEKEYREKQTLRKKLLLGVALNN
jgi:predicted secreted protein